MHHDELQRYGLSCIRWVLQVLTLVGVKDALQFVCSFSFVVAKFSRCWKAWLVCRMVVELHGRDLGSVMSGWGQCQSRNFMRCSIGWREENFCTSSGWWRSAGWSRGPILTVLSSASRREESFFRLRYAQYVRSIQEAVDAPLLSCAAPRSCDSGSSVYGSRWYRLCESVNPALDREVLLFRSLLLERVRLLPCRIRVVRQSPQCQATLA